MTSSRESSPTAQKPDDIYERRSATMAAALRAMVRDLYHEQFGHQVDEATMDLTVAFSVDPTNGWDVQFKESLPKQLVPQLQAHEATTQAFQAGKVYCFQCGTSQCDHSRAPGTTDIFSGYNQLGVPQWMEYGQFLLGIRDERVDRLFGDRPKLVARVLDGEVLRSRQFAFFGKTSKTFNVLGQVMVGYFILAQGTPKAQKVALCLQVVESYNPNGQTQYKLNTMIPGPDAQALHERLDRTFPWIQQACQGAKRQLQKLVGGKGRRRSASPFLRAEQVRKILDRLAGDLERGARKSKRQTTHAKFRETMERPIHKAMADLRQARPERMFRDLKTKAIMVCGNKGRCHAFNESGHHITSFVIHGDAIHQRVRKRRWAHLKPEQSHRFLSSFQAQDRSHGSKD